MSDKNLTAIQKRSFLWKFFAAVTIFIVTMICGELFARFYLGLGTPPLSITHPTIEYMFRPDQDVYRFGNHITVNTYGMRSPDFTEKKRQQSEERIMIFGDSVINGGSLTDQEQLASTLVAKERAEFTGHSVVVGNISARSWGPGNWLAYAREYGFFDADVVFLVLSSHDYADNPTYEPLNPETHPTEKPVSALIEGITRYLPRYLPSLLKVKETKSNSETSHVNAIKKGLGDLREFLALAEEKVGNVVVLLHATRNEARTVVFEAGHDEIIKLCSDIGIPIVSMQPFFAESLKRDVNPYRDEIHLNADGQKIISKIIINQVRN